AVTDDVARSFRCSLRSDRRRTVHARRPVVDGLPARESEMTRLSIGIPVHNEEAVVPELLARLRPVLDSLSGGPHEVVFVDDGSTDRSRELLTRAAQDDRRLKVIALSRNFGHQAALSAALDHATGDAVVLMDADLQDEPEIIPELVRRHEAGADVVYARRA